MVVARAAASMLYGFKPHDPLTLTVAVVVLTLVAAVASFLPAHRAAETRSHGRVARRVVLQRLTSLCAYDRLASFSSEVSECLFALCALSCCCQCIFVPAPSRAQSSDPQTVTYRATIDNVKYLYATVPPVAHLKPTNILDANSLDCFGNAIKKPGDTMAMIKGDNPLTGPFYIDGAEPGDTLVVKVLDLKVDGDQGIGGMGPYFGALNGTKYTAMIHPALPEKFWFYPSITRTTRRHFKRSIRASR